MRSFQSPSFPIHVSFGGAQPVRHETGRSIVCDRPKCRMTTLDLSGVCYLHRKEWGAGPAEFIDRGDWSPGTVHPLGGYDEIVCDKGVSFYRNHREHREDGPAVLYGNAFDGVHHELWRQNGQPCRVGGPTDVSWRGGGARHEQWFTPAGKLSRLDGPAEVRVNSDGVLVYERYVVDGEDHRLDGPARVYYDAITGEVDPERVRYAVHGISCSEQEHTEIRRALDDGAPLDWALAFATGAAS